MKSRGLVVVLALVLATLATAGVFLYMQGVKEDAKTGGDLVTVVVSKVDVPANTDLDALIEQGQFTTQEFPSDAVVDGAVTSVAQLSGLRNSVVILAGEQIPMARVQGGKLPGGPLSIPEGYQALTVSLQAPRSVGAALAGGDNIAVYATFTGVALKEKGQTTTTTASQERVSVTTVLVPQVKVLRVVTPQEESGGMTGQSTGQNLSGNIAITVALLPEDAQKFVYALEQGTVYFGLLPPGEEGTALEPLTVESILYPPKTKGANE